MKPEFVQFEYNGAKDDLGLETSSKYRCPSFSVGDKIKLKGYDSGPYFLVSALYKHKKETRVKAQFTDKDCREGFVDLDVKMCLGVMEPGEITMVNLKCLCDDQNKAKFVLDGMTAICLVCGYKQTIVSSLIESCSSWYKEARDQDLSKMKNPVDKRSKEYCEQKLNKNKAEAKASLIRQVKGETE